MVCTSNASQKHHYIHSDREHVQRLVHCLKHISNSYETYTTCMLQFLLFQMFNLCEFMALPNHLD